MFYKVRENGHTRYFLIYNRILPFLQTFRPVDFFSFACMETKYWYIIINPVTARVVGAPQMILHHSIGTGKLKQLVNCHNDH